MGICSILCSALCYGIMVSTGVPVPSDVVAPASRAELRIITAYSREETCVGRPDCRMANGKPPSVGYAACSRSIPLGTKIGVLGKVYECGDRLSKKYDDRVDLFVSSYEEAIKFGKRTERVIIYGK